MKKIAVALLLAVFAAPLAYLVLLAAAETWPFPDLLPTAFSLENTRSVLGANNQLLAAFARSVGISTVVALVATATGFWAASRLAYHPRGRVFRSLAWLPYAFSPVIYAFCLLYFFHKTGLAGSIVGVGVAQVIIAFPCCFLLFFNHFDQKMLDFEQLTATLGGSRGQYFWRVLLPVSRPVLWLGFLQAFLISWFEYGLTSVIGLGQVRTLTVAVYQFIGESNAYLAALASCLVGLPPLAFLFLGQKIARPT